MLKETGENIKDYGIIAILMTNITLLIRPYVDLKTTLKEMAITFLFSMCSGLILVGLDIPQPVRYGCAGMIGLFAVKLYLIIEKLLHTVEENPEKVIEHVKRLKDGK